MGEESRAQTDGLAAGGRLRPGRGRTEDWDVVVRYARAPHSLCTLAHRRRGGASVHKEDTVYTLDTNAMFNFVERAWMKKKV